MKGVAGVILSGPLLGNQADLCPEGSGCIDGSEEDQDGRCEAEHYKSDEEEQIRAIDYFVRSNILQGKSNIAVISEDRKVNI